MPQLSAVYPDDPVFLSLQVVRSFGKLGLSENRAAQNLLGLAELVEKAMERENFLELIITFPYFGHQSGHILGLNG